jgi:hypothetical protein
VILTKRKSQITDYESRFTNPTESRVVPQIVVQAPSFDVRRGRRIEIKEGASEQKSNQPNQKT